MLMGRMSGRGAPGIAIAIAPRLELGRRRSHLQSGHCYFSVRFHTPSQFSTSGGLS